MARTPSALAATSPGSTSTPAQPPAQPGVTDRWAQAQVLQEKTTPHPTDPEQVTRVRLLRTDFKYPLVRVEETLQLSPGGAAPTLVSQVSMVADHLVVKLAAGADRAALEQALAALGGTLRAANPAAVLGSGIAETVKGTHAIGQNQAGRDRRTQAECAAGKRTFDGFGGCPQSIGIIEPPPYTS